MVTAPMTVVETGEFLKRAKPLMSDSERAELVAFIGSNPEAGDIIPDTGGVRKIRWALEGMGKRGGARSDLLPQFAITRVYALRVCEEPEGEPQQG